LWITKFLYKIVSGTRFLAICSTWWFIGDVGTLQLVKKLNLWTRIRESVIVAVVGLVSMPADTSWEKMLIT